MGANGGLGGKRLRRLTYIVWKPQSDTRNPKIWTRKIPGINFHIRQRHRSCPETKHSDQKERGQPKYNYFIPI
jgi:hypothetical protein